MYYVVFVLIFLLAGVANSQKDAKLEIVTVASEETGGYDRFRRSARAVNLDSQITVLGLDQEWKGGDMDYPGGGFKINLLKEGLKKYKDDRETILMFVDSYDVVFTAGADAILDKFAQSGAHVLFSAEGYCWPDSSLAKKYPEVQSGKHYLCSGGIIGYGADIYAVLTHKVVADGDDDQLYYTNIYLDAELRDKFKIKLDHKSEIFQNLNGARDDVKLMFEEGLPYVENTAYSTRPIVLHGNGLSKMYLSFLANYVPAMWTVNRGCSWCDDDLIRLNDREESAYPLVTVALFIEKPTPFMEEHLQLFTSQFYPKKRIDLFIHSATRYHAQHIDTFLAEFKDQYRSIHHISANKSVTEWVARNAGISHCVEKGCEFYFVVDSEAQLVNPRAIQLLVEQNLPVLAPLLTRPMKLWSNFWGSLSEDGYYARSEDYIELVESRRKGVWSIAHVHTCYMLRGEVARALAPTAPYIHKLTDADMAFGFNLRSKHHLLYLSNRVHFGHLLNADAYETSHVHNDIYTIFENQLDWEERYIDKDYAKMLEPDTVLEQPCPDVYWFPLTSKRFCEELIDIMNNYGQWSSGTNDDERLDGGYEAVPTRDIHMRQVGLHDTWLHMLKSYAQPIQQKVYIGYNDDPPHAIMNFVVRYKIDEQPSLRPHHDSSTYTINLALNQAGEDYTGGGVNFIRYNCSIVETKRGWAFIHPGKLTHYHEGLLIGDGIRYIMVSFVDP